MRSAKKARSEQLLEQLNPYHDAPDILGDDGDGGAVVEDLLEDFSSSSPQAKKKAALRRRAPLDSALQQGVYAAVPRHEAGAVDQTTAEAAKVPKKQKSSSKRSRMEADGDGGYDAKAADSAMDDIFGLLDGGEDDGLDDEAAQAGALADEEAYTKFLEEKQEKAAKARKAFGEAVGASGNDEGGILAQLSNLRNRQMQLVEGGETQNQDESAQQGTGGGGAREALRHSIVVFNALLGTRVALQGAISGAVQLPQFYAMPHFLKHSAAVVNEQKVCSRLCRDMLDVIAELASEYATPIDEVASKNKKSGVAFPPTLPLEKIFPGISSLHSKMMAQVDDTLAYWGSKISSPNAAKLQAVNQPLMDQIRAAVAAKTARIEQTSQKNRAHVKIFGHPHHFQSQLSTAEETKKQLDARRALDIANGDIDREIFDDGDFIRELVHKTGTSGIGTAAVDALMRSTEKLSAAAGSGIGGVGSKVGFHRLTKGKSVSYDPRPKLVGFMAKVPYGTDDDQHATLLQSLFR